ncbi:hypothetical protein GTY75_09170 [Streptomyces sp. SID8381]|uniref:hypothetical protein n=1 Tax=unclassified Streptomyces TaxID=2593676 RepID=UPI0003758BDD|nr:MULTISPECIES: hypothetical protein [unclassified Streptomyces]MYX26837.1 hypothetical protein [Streptomyces sp. SID8381]
MSSRARAASLLASALDTVYADDTEMTVSVHATNGSLVTIVGRAGAEPRRTDGTDAGTSPIDFEPKDLAALLDYLASLLTTPMPKGALSVRVPDPAAGGHLVWVWSLATFAPLRFEEAAKDFPGADVPSSLRAYGHISDRERVSPHLPLTPLTDRAHVTLIHLAHN